MLTFAHCSTTNASHKNVYHFSQNTLAFNSLLVFLSDIYLRSWANVGLRNGERRSTLRFMAQEIETKVLDIDRDEVVKKLGTLGAKKIAETRLTVDWYRPKGIGEGEDPWFLRIRSN